MAYRIEITDTALAEAEDYVRFILAQSNDGEAARNWRDGLFEAAASLRDLPGRCPLIPERREFNFDLHQLVYASHRIVFRVQSDVVMVLRIYHAARKPLKTLRTGLPRKNASRL